MTTPASKIRTERALLERLVDLGNKFRNTPIVDDDFLFQKGNFDDCLREATEYVKNNLPVKVNERIMKEDGCMGEQDVIVITVS